MTRYMSPLADLLMPADREASQRAARLQDLGLGQAPDRELDAFIRELAEAARKLSGINHTPVAIIVADRQYLFSCPLIGQPLPESAYKRSPCRCRNQPFARVEHALQVAYADDQR